MSKEKLAELSFEEAIEKLEKIVERLEEGDVPLEKAINYFQEGMNLSKICNDKLVNVQNKMTEILSKNDELKRFELEED